MLLFIPVAIINFLHQKRKGWKGIFVTESNSGRNFCFLIKLFCFVLKQFIYALEVRQKVLTTIFLNISNFCINFVPGVYYYWSVSNNKYCNHVVSNQTCVLGKYDLKKYKVVKSLFNRMTLDNMNYIECNINKPW